uniref:Rhodanese domain-containing protein n=1 Tax=Arundo donax TaxID=35708 RepID=A0A0A8ZF57_ARUDO
MAPPHESSSASPAVSAAAVATVDVTAARDLVASGGHRYLDVRTEEELGKGHLQNSLNVPYMFIAPQGREKNPLFVEQVASLFNKEDLVVVVYIN